MINEDFCLFVWYLTKKTTHITVNVSIFNFQLKTIEWMVNRFACLQVVLDHISPLMTKSSYVLNSKRKSKSNAIWKSLLIEHHDHIRKYCSILCQTETVIFQSSSNDGYISCAFKFFDNMHTSFWCLGCKNRWYFTILRWVSKHENA